MIKSLITVLHVVVVTEPIILRVTIVVSSLSAVQVLAAPWQKGKTHFSRPFPPSTFKIISMLPYVSIVVKSIAQELPSLHDHLYCARAGSPVRLDSHYITRQESGDVCGLLIL